MGRRDQRKIAIGLLWVWIVLEGGWVYLYLFEDTTGKEFLLGTITCLLGIAGAIATMRRTAREAKHE